MLRTILAVFLCFTLWAAVVAAQDTVDFNNAGVEAYNNKKFDVAISYLEKACRQTPDNPVVRRNLLNAYQSMADSLAKAGNLRSAVRQLETAIPLEPDNPSPLKQLGSYYLQSDDVKNAIQRLEQAITVKPGDLDAHELLGEAYYRDNDLPSARTQWEYVLKVDPKRTNLKERYAKAFREESVESEFDRYRSRHFSINYPPDVPNEIRKQVVTILDSAYVDIGRQLGSTFPPPPIQAVLYNAQQFSEATQMHDYVGALYDGKIRSPLTDDHGQWLAEPELRRRLTHEYVHVVVRNIAGASVPWWLNEGLAQYLSQPMTEGATQQLQTLYREGKAFSLADISGQEVQQKSKEKVTQAYLQAHAAVNMLWSRYGKGKMLLLLQTFSRDVPQENALRQVYRKKLATIDNDLANIYK